MENNDFFVTLSKETVYKNKWSSVTKKDSFVMNDAWRDSRGKEAMLKWNLTALTYMSCDDWLNFFDEVEYKGDYYWFFAI